MKRHQKTLTDGLANLQKASKESRDQACQLILVLSPF